MSPSTKPKITRRGFLEGATAISAGISFVAGIKQVWAAPKENVSNWFRDIYRLLHIDGGVVGQKDFEKSFDAEATAERFKEIGAQMVSYQAKSRYSYYPSKIGTPDPTIDRDCFGELTRALKKRGIKSIAYFHISRERKFHKLHPDWVINTDPSVTVARDADTSEMGTMCLNSPYLEEVVIPQMKEIVDLYDVDGFFIDIVLQPYLWDNCYCKYCRELFAMEVGGEIPLDDNDPRAFAYRKWSNMHFEAVMEKYYRALAEIKPDITFINNHCWNTRYPITPPSYVMHLTWDTPTPNAGLYAWNFSFEARYLATLNDVLPDLTWSCMNVSSQGWGDYELRETEAFLQECAIMLAGCGRTYPSYNPYPTGNPAPALMEAFGEVNKRTIALEPFVKNCKPVKDVVILHSADSVWSRAPMKPHVSWVPSTAYHPVAGAHKAMIEGHVQIALANSEVFLKTINEYNAIVLPTQRILSEQECVAIRRFVRNGGALLVTGETGMRDTDNKPLSDFSIADVLGVKYQETIDTSISYLRVKSKDYEFGIPAYDIPVVGKYVRFKPTTAKTLVEIVPPYKGVRSGTPPPAELSEGPGVTINSYGKGKAVYCASELFAGYYIKDTPVLRKLAMWMLNLAYSVDSRTLVIENTPINVEVFYNQRGNERFIHLVNYSGDKREVGSAHAQDFPIIHGMRVNVRLKDRPVSITTVPGGKKVTFTYRNGLATFNAEPLAIHDVYRIEV